MLGDAYTEFPGKSAEELYQAIRRNEMNPRGSAAPLRHWIFWMVSVDGHKISLKAISDSGEIVDECVLRDKLHNLYAKI
ncbi:MAG: hypothetical protein N2V72_08500, partial [Methanophagales archaeon]|nr:hypothetical protein [Methanophagales archaeon]